MRTVMLAAIGALLLAAPGAAYAEGPAGPKCRGGKVNVKHPRCHGRPEGKRYVQRAYRDDKWGARNRREFGHLRSYARNRKTAKLMTKHRRRVDARERAERRRARQAARLTPYCCLAGQRWAIPVSIVACESGGSWSAYNGSSGARGPYQFLGWPVPWPVRTEADRIAHHRMAARLWDGGAGRSHWVC